ncbi:hypothetical protein LguiA_008722 [Lonicera macranthoides]
MVSLQILKSNYSPFSVSQSNSLPKNSFFCSEFSSDVAGKRNLRFNNRRNSKLLMIHRRFSVCCKSKEGDNNKSNGEEPPESLFTKELKRRGINSSSLLEETNSSISGDEEIRYKEEDGGFTNRNAVSTDVEKGLSNQRERSMALNSEGLEGLIPRGKVLLNLGGTFFLAFGPFILITVTFFSALYIYFGPTFIHDGSKTSASLPQYIDPYSLLEDERISQTPPRLN